MHDEISKLAYELWQANGGETTEVENWLEAEKIIEGKTAIIIERPNESSNLPS